MHTPALPIRQDPSDLNWDFACIAYSFLFCLPKYSCSSFYLFHFIFHFAVFLVLSHCSTCGMQLCTIITYFQIA